MNLKRDRQCAYYVTLETRLRNHRCSEKARSITYAECVFVALFIEHEIHTRKYSHLWPARLYGIFPHYLINGMIFEKKNKIKCGF
jgi:hypothetical protein